MTTLDNLFAALRSFMLPETAGLEAQDRATGALLGITEPLPAGVADLRQGPEALIATFPGARLIAGNPEAFKAGGDLVAVKAWASPRGGFTAGCPLFVNSSNHYGYLTCRPERQGASRSASAVTTLSADTLKAEGDRQYPTTEVKFKFGGSGLARLQALMDIKNWLLNGDGKRKDLILVAQLLGPAYPETEKETGAPTGRTVQKVGGFYLLQVPAVNAQEDGKVGNLPLSNKPTFLPARGVVAGAQAAASAHQARAAVANAADALSGIAADVDSL